MEHLLSMARKGEMDFFFFQRSVVTHNDGKSVRRSRSNGRDSSCLVWGLSRWVSSGPMAGAERALIALDKQAFRISCEEKQGGLGYKRPLERFKCAPL